jgi:phage shock protein C
LDRKEIFMRKKLYRVRRGRIIAGVCGGVAKYLGIDPKIVRLLCLALIAAYGSGLLVYIIFAIFVPKEPK